MGLAPPARIRLLMSMWVDVATIQPLKLRPVAGCRQGFGATMGQAQWPSRDGPLARDLAWHRHSVDLKGSLH